MGTPDPYGPYQRDEVVHEVPTGRLKVVRVVNGLIRVITGLFAVVLGHPHPAGRGRGEHEQRLRPVRHWLGGRR